MTHPIDRYKLEMALSHVNRISELITNNEYEKHMNGHLVSIQVELQRQLSFYKNA